MNTFETKERGKVEQILRDQGYHFEWRAGGLLHTRMTLSATGKHHRTRHPYWLNQAPNWHPSEFDSKTREQLRTLYGDDSDLPKNVTFGDGSPIPDEDVEHVRSVLRAHENVFTWETGDLLILDNEWIAHGRQPFSGERQILVAMG